MIANECAIFAALFCAGLLAELLSAALLTLGKGSKVARAVFDFLTPIAVGAIYFFALRFSALGVFRVYTVVAFVLGGLAARWGLGKCSPALRRFARKVVLPIKSLEESLEKRVSDRLLPLRKRREERRRTRLAAREEKREAREKARLLERKKKVAEAKKKAEEIRRKKALSEENRRRRRA